MLDQQKLQKKTAHNYFDVYTHEDVGIRKRLPQSMIVFLENVDVPIPTDDAFAALDDSRPGGTPRSC